MVMMKQILWLLLTAQVFFTTAQTPNCLSPTSLGFMFHTVKKSPILEQNIGEYVQFLGPEIRFNPRTLNLDSIEKLIFADPNLLYVHQSMMAKSSKGIVIELANKIALWELNQLLAKKRFADSLKQNDSEEYKHYEAFLIKNLPENALELDQNELVPKKQIIQLLHPDMGLKEERDFLASLFKITEYDIYLISKSIQDANQQWVNQRTQEIFNCIGGLGIINNGNFIAGTDKAPEDTYEYREKNESGRYFLEIPKSNGLFAYQLKSTKEIEREKEITYSNFFTNTDYLSAEGNRLTNVHFDVWGYTKNKQVTVIVEKGGSTYPLFSSGENRFLSPDSAFSGTFTFQKTIMKLDGKIKELHELIYGKRGFDYWIKFYHKKMDYHEKIILVAESDLKMEMMEPITTSTKPSRAIRKKKKKAMKDLSKSKAKDDIYQPTTHSNKSERAKLQDKIVENQAMFEECRTKKILLEKQKKEAIALKENYQSRLAYLKSIYGINWVPFKKKGDLFIFNDSTYFNYQLQDLYFHQKDSSELITIKIISIPEGPLSGVAEDVAVHSSVISCDKHYNDFLFQEIVNFSKNSDQKLLANQDSLNFKNFKRALTNKKYKLDVSLVCEGYGEWSFNQVKPSKSQHDVQQNGIMWNDYQKIFVKKGKKNTLTIENYYLIDGDLSALNDRLKEKVKANALSLNQALCIQNSLQFVSKYQTELKQQLSQVGDRTTTEKVISKLEKAFKSAKIVVNGQTYKWSEFY